MFSLTRSISVILTLALNLIFPNFSLAQIVSNPKAAATPSADILIDIVKSYQKRLVKESYGEKPSECFTDRDLEGFRDRGEVKKVIEFLRKDRRFLSAAQSLKVLPQLQREDFLKRVSATYKPTWGQLGGIDRKGQTDAGQQAEREIATAISALAEEISQ